MASRRRSGGNGRPGGPFTQGPRSADQARTRSVRGSAGNGSRAAVAFGKRRFGTSGMGFWTPSRGAVTHRHHVLTAPPAAESRMPPGLAEPGGGGRRVVTSRAAASDDAHPAQGDGRCRARGAERPEDRLVRRAPAVEHEDKGGHPGQARSRALIHYKTSRTPNVRTTWRSWRLGEKPPLEGLAFPCAMHAGR
jgi:hypothetical protein